MIIDRRWLVWSAWFSLFAIVVVTFLPIGLRPATGFSPNLERFVVMAIMSAMFVLAYPTRFWVIVLALVSVSALIEPLQFFAAGRHPSLRDALVKISGVVVGAALSYCALNASNRERGANE